MGRLSRIFDRVAVRLSGRFDATYYLENNLDVAAAGCDPVDHFCDWGWKEMRNPSADFDSGYYASQYIAARARAINPVVHWILFGAWRGRATNYPEAVAFLKNAKLTRQDHDLIFVVHDCSRTGAPIFLLRLLKAMIGNGMIDPSKTGLIILSGGPLLAEFSALADTFLLWLVPEAERKVRIKSFIENNKTSLIYVNSIVSSKIIKYLDMNCNKLICHVHEMPALASHFTNECNLLSNYCRSYVAVSEQSVSVINDQIKPRSANINLIRPGVVVRPSRKFSYFSERPLRILGCGTASMRKGTDLFCDIAEILSGLDIAFEMQWVGGKGDVDIAARIENDHLQAHLSWSGEQEDMDRIFESADVLLMTSREDPFPLVVLEAAERGVPTICFDQRAGGIHMFIQQGAGIVVPYLDIQEMAMQLCRLVNDPALLTSLGDRAREIVIRDFNMDDVSRRIAMIINSQVKI